MYPRYRLALYALAMDFVLPLIDGLDPPLYAIAPGPYSDGGRRGYIGIYTPPPKKKQSTLNFLCGCFESLQ